MPEELETVLRLVAEGKLSPEEAAPIIEALSRATGRRDERRRARRDDPPDRRLDFEPPGFEPGSGPRVRPRAERQLRIRVTERGRQVVNLRVPLAMAEMAGRMVPGISEHLERIQAAVDENVSGAIIDVEDEDGDGVLISLE